MPPALVVQVILVFERRKDILMADREQVLEYLRILGHKVEDVVIVDDVPMSIETAELVATGQATVAEIGAGLALQQRRHAMLPRPI